MKARTRVLMAIFSLGLILSLSGCQALFGIINPKSNDAKLLTLEVTDGASALTLTPTFSASNMTYTIAAPNATTVSAPSNHRIRNAH